MSSEARPGRLEERTAIRPGTEFGDAGLPEGELRLIRTADGHHWDALLQTPEVPLAGDLLAIVVHGAMGNYLGGVPRRISVELARRGIPTLTINTRLANFGVIYGGGLLTAAVADLEGAVTHSRDLGARQIALVGYGQGASLVALYQATVGHPDIRALIHVAHPGNPGVAQRERWNRLGAAPSWDSVAAEARARLARGAPDDIFVVERGSGPTSAPSDAEIWTWHTWWDGRGSGGPHLDGAELASRAGVPQLIVQPSTPLACETGEALRAAVERANGPPAALEILGGSDAALWGRTPEVAARAAAFLAEVVSTAAASRLRAGAASARVVTLRAADGGAHDALLVEDATAATRRAEATGRRVAIVHLHGNQGNFSVGSLRYLPQPLASVGTPVLALETRLANASQIFGAAVFEDALLDIGGAIDWLAERGFDHALLSGYSLGAVLAARAAAERWALPLRGAVLVGCARSLPESSRARMEGCGAQPSYSELVERCRAAIAEGREELLLVRRLYGPEPSPRLAGVYTTSTWWHSRGPEALAAIPEHHLARATCPILLVQGTADTTVDPDDALALADAVRSGGNGDVEIAWIDGSDHLMHGHADELVSAVRQWVDERA